MNKIRFTFEGVEYEVGMEAYDKGLPIQLPDGRLLKVTGGWKESMPPIPDGLQVMKVAIAMVVNYPTPFAK